jgi:hypothetical protein
MDTSLEGLSQEAIVGLAQIAKGLSDNPDTRKSFLGLVKAADPSASIPELDISNQITSAVAEERSKREALENKIMERDARDNVINRREAIKKSKGLSDEDVAEVEKIMVEKGISNHDTAAEFMVAQRQSAKPTPFQAGYGSHQAPQVDTKPYGGNIAQWSRNEAANTIADIRAGRIKI